MSHSKTTLLQNLFDSVVESLGSTQSHKITHAYPAYVRNTPGAYFVYAALGVYFAYRCKQAYDDKVVHQDLEESTTKDHNSDRRKLDNIAMGLCAFASLAAFNWSIAPIIPIPHVFAIASCFVAEGAFYYSGANKNHRDTCKVEGKDKFMSKCKKWALTTPIVDLILETTGAKSYMVG